VCVRRKRVVELVIVRCEMLGKSQAEIRQKSGRNVVPPGFCVVPAGLPYIYLYKLKEINIFLD
jgi:hypothetical protein